MLKSSVIQDAFSKAMLLLLLEAPPWAALTYEWILAPSTLFLSLATPHSLRTSGTLQESCIHGRGRKLAYQHLQLSGSWGRNSAAYKCFHWTEPLEHKMHAVMFQREIHLIPNKELKISHMKCILCVRACLAFLYPQKCIRYFRPHVSAVLTLYREKCESAGQI